MDGEAATAGGHRPCHGDSGDEDAAEGGGCGYDDVPADPSQTKQSQPCGCDADPSQASQAVSLSHVSAAHEPILHMRGPHSSTVTPPVVRTHRGPPAAGDDRLPAAAYAPGSAPPPPPPPGGAGILGADAEGVRLRAAGGAGGGGVDGVGQASAECGPRDEDGRASAEPSPGGGGPAAGGDGPPLRHRQPSQGGAGLPVVTSVAAAGRGGEEGMASGGDGAAGAGLWRDNSGAGHWQDAAGGGDGAGVERRPAGLSPQDAAVAGADLGEQLARGRSQACDGAEDSDAGPGRRGASGGDGNGHAAAMLDGGGGAGGGGGVGDGRGGAAVAGKRLWSGSPRCVSNSLPLLSLSLSSLSLSPSLPPSLFLFPLTHTNSVRVRGGGGGWTGRVDP